ncbi:MAG TPA: hypothetical protein VF723_09590 [Pyrinomonadaceae bacterium]
MDYFAASALRVPARFAFHLSPFSFKLLLMGYFLGIFKSLFFWSYARNTWQYDVLCALILAFIFLTPKAWFDGGAPLKGQFISEPGPRWKHQNPVASKILLVGANDLTAGRARDEAESGIRAGACGRDREVEKASAASGVSGQGVAYEVDIR